MADWDASRLYTVPQQLSLGFQQQETVLSQTDVIERTRDFIRTFARAGTEGELFFVYRDALLHNAANKKYFVEIDIRDLKSQDEDLADVLVLSPALYIPMMELGARQMLLGLMRELDAPTIPPVQITFKGDLPAHPIRDITAEDINKMLLVPGIVIQAQRTKPRATMVCLRCKNCGQERRIPIVPGFGTSPIPRKCQGRSNDDVEANGGAPVPAAECPQDPFVIIPDKCTMVDQQVLKLQEAPEEVPTGEMPRTIMIVVDRQLADRVPPGSRISVVAIASVIPDNSGKGNGGSTANAAPAGRQGARLAVRQPYLRVLGVEFAEAGTGRSVATFSAEEENVFTQMATDPAIFERLSNSVAPSIKGDYTDDIKRAIMALLLGGSRKLLADGARLRGDINVLMLGDPSTAKSQFLKFVEKVAPVGVYTSGKGSSAAGLTASVLKSPSGEFFLEGGAMVMADGGVVCIDEFDKMREEDRVAIHEAMEQQTISVAKAGITTILNSRCSVLAAANPVYGRYDDSKTATENIDLLPTILSRFDLIFIVRDTRNTARDLEIARHVVGVHLSFKEPVPGEAAAESVGAGAGAGAGADIDIVTMKKFITFARNKCAPRLNAEAAGLLAGKYADIRAAHAMRESGAQASKGENGEGRDSASVIPITVRQLEALVRITESVAKASLRREAGVGDVEEALRLFSVSTLAAAAAGLGTADNVTPEIISKVKAAEGRILGMVAAGGTIALSRVKERLLVGGVEESIINLAVRTMERRDELRLINERRTIQRSRN